LEVAQPADEYELLEDEIRIADFVPLVVNTMGWTKGLGGDLNRRIEGIVEPGVLFEFNEPHHYGQGQAYRQHGVQMDEEDELLPYDKHFLEPILGGTLQNRWTPADHRSLNILSYFHAIFPSPSSFSLPTLQQVTALTWSTTLPLLARRPYEVTIREAIDQVVLVGANGDDVVSDEVGRVLVGAVVGLVECDDDGTTMMGFPLRLPDDSVAAAASPSVSASVLAATGDLGGSGVDANRHGSDPGPEPQIEAQEQEEPNRIPYTQSTPPPSPQISHLHGLALIRSISPSQTHLHVLTPLHPLILSNARQERGKRIVMVKGEMEMPIWGLVDWRTLALGRNGSGGGVNTSNNEGAPLGWDTTKMQMQVPYLQWGRVNEGVLGGEKRRVRRNLMRRGQA
jgi:polynucleotide 5'-hydroxyl-kinase GRC3/NOL9